RRTVMLACDAIRFWMILIATLVVWQDWSPVIVYVATAISAILVTSYYAASAAILPTFAETPAELTAANAVTGIIDSVGFFVGPAIAGAVLAVANTETAFLVTAAAVVVSFVVNLGLPTAAVAGEKDEEQKEPETPSSALARFSKDVSAGFS